MDKLDVRLQRPASVIRFQGDHDGGGGGDTRSSASVLASYLPADRLARVGASRLPHGRDGRHETAALRGASVDQSAARRRAFALSSTRQRSAPAALQQQRTTLSSVVQDDNERLFSSRHRPRDPLDAHRHASRTGGGGGGVSGAASLPQRTTLTARQRQRESEYRRQISERDAEIGRLKEHTRTLGERLSRRNDLNQLRLKDKTQLATIIQQLQKEKNALQQHVTSTVDALRRQCDDECGRDDACQAENGALLAQLQQLERLVHDHQNVQTQFAAKIAECEVLASHVQASSELCGRLGRRLDDVSAHNSRLSEHNEQLQQRHVRAIGDIDSQCASLQHNLGHVEVQCESAQQEVRSLRGKVMTLESVVRQMREAGERKRDLLRQHDAACQQLQQKRGELASGGGGGSGDAQHDQAATATVRALESKVRELEKKAEAQKLQQEELMLEVTVLKQQARASATRCMEAESGVLSAQQWHCMSNDGSRVSSPLAAVATAAAPTTSDVSSDLVSSESPDMMAASGGTTAVATSRCSSVTHADIERIMESMERDNRVLNELDRSRCATAMAVGAVPSSASARCTPYDLCVAPATAALLGDASLAEAMGDAALTVCDLVNGDAGAVVLPPTAVVAATVADADGCVSTALVPASLVSVAGAAAQLDSLDVPTRGRCRVFVAMYPYDPLMQSPNDAPHLELPLSVGDYVLVWSAAGCSLTSGDSLHGYLDGELLNGRRGAVPSNFLRPVVGEQLVQFHRAVVDGLLDESRALMTTLPADLDLANQSNEALLVPRPSAAAACGTATDADMLVVTADNQADGGVPLTADELVDLEPVPPPRRLTLQRCMARSIIVSWQAPLYDQQLAAAAAAASVERYHVHLDGLLRCTVLAGQRLRALIEDVDLSRPHRVSVRAVTRQRRSSRDAACTLVVGAGAGVAPSCVRAVGVTPTSACIVWLPSDSSLEHSVCVNSVEVCTVPPGVYRHKITGIAPNTLCRVTVNARADRGVASSSTAGAHPSCYPPPSQQQQPTPVACSSLIEFRTPAKCVPDPPLHVQCEPGPQHGSLLVTWLPVTLKSTLATSNGAAVTGYVVFADGKMVADLTSPTCDHAVVRLADIAGFQPRYVTVRTKARDCLSVDSTPFAIPLQCLTEPPYGDELFAIPEECEPYVSAVDYRQRAAAGAFYGGNGVGPTDDAFSDSFTAPYGGRTAGGGGGAAIPHIEITHDSASEERGSLDLSEEDVGARPTRGRFRRGVAGGDMTAPARCNTMAAGSAVRRRDGGSGAVSRRRYTTTTTVNQQQQQQQARIFVALFDYDPPTMSPNPGACDEELPFSEGQLIRVFGDKDADGFFWGAAGGRSGYVPCNMVSEVQVDDNEQPVGGGGGGGVGRDRWGDIYANMPTRRMVALYDYDPRELSPNVDADVELSFRTGNVIVVFGDMDDDGFYMGELGGRRGLVPSNFLTDAPADYTEPPTHGDAERPQHAPGPGVHGPPPPPRDKTTATVAHSGGDAGQRRQQQAPVARRHAVANRHER